MDHVVSYYLIAAPLCAGAAFVAGWLMGAAHAARRAVVVTMQAPAR